MPAPSVLIPADDDAYEHWRRKNPKGYIVHIDAAHQPVVHKADCRILQQRKTSGVTGTQHKVLAMKLFPLARWAREEQDVALRTCDRCKPNA